MKEKLNALITGYTKLLQQATNEAEIKLIKQFIADLLALQLEEE